MTDGHIIKNAIGERGAALLVLLFVVMAITVLSLGFLSRSDVELACGENMILRTQMDYLAESGLEHAKGLILSPQDIDSEYWTGAAGQQIDTGNDYYDVTVVRDDSEPANRCNYIIDCNSYRLKDGQKIGFSSIEAKLRLDPCIAYWVGSDTTISERITINGDVYCAGDITNSGNIHGDVFAGGTIAGINIEGHRNMSVSQAPVDWPRIEPSELTPTYYIGTTTYSAEFIPSYYHPSGIFTPSASNPGGVRYRSNLRLSGDVNIEGALVVSGDLIITGSNNVITAVKNFPALVVGDDLNIHNGSLEVNGLAIVKGKVLISSNGGRLNVLGGLFAEEGIVEFATDSSGNAYRANLHYSPTWHPSDGQRAGALEFDGVNDYAQTADDLNKLQLTNDYTLSVWIKADSNQKQWAGIFSKCNPSGSTNHWTLQFDKSRSRKLIIFHPTASWDTGIRLNEIAGQWHHICVVRSGDTMKSYLDGVPRNAGTWANNPGSGDGHFNIGADRTASPNYLYKGFIDDIRIYNQAHDANDIYPPAGLLPGIIGYWKLDEAGCDITITAAPCKSAVLIWSAPGDAERWGQAAGAFFKSIKRK